MITVDITGGRYTADRRPVRVPIEQLLAFWSLFCFKLRADTLGHGGAIGTDTHVAEWVRERSRGRIRILECKVDTAIDGPWPAAGCRRNGRMLRTHNPIALIAFPGDRGTPDCVCQALKLKIPVYIWDPLRKFTLVPVVEKGQPHARKQLPSQ